MKYGLNLPKAKHLAIERMKPLTRLAGACIKINEETYMKKTGFWVCIFLGLFFSVGGLVASKLSLLDFCLNPAGVLGIILLVWAIIIKKRERK